MATGVWNQEVQLASACKVREVRPGRRNCQKSRAGVSGRGTSQPCLEDAGIRCEREVDASRGEGKMGVYCGENG